MYITASSSAGCWLKGQHLMSLLERDNLLSESIHRELPSLQLLLNSTVCKGTCM